MIFTQKTVTLKIILIEELSHSVVKFLFVLWGILGVVVVFALKGELLFKGPKHFNFATLVRLF